MRNLYLIFIVLFLLAIPLAASTSTQQYNKIFLNPFYRQTLASNTNYTYDIMVNPPDGVKSVVNAIISFNAQINGQTQLFTLWVNNNTCNTRNYTVATAFSATGNVQFYFDCSNIITKAGNYSVTLRSDVNTGAMIGWLDLVYMNNPISMISSGTEYQAGNAGKIFVRLLDGNSNPVNLGVCNNTVYFPNNTKFINNQQMIFLEKGFYYYDFTVPNVIGNYMVGFDCLFPSTFYSQNMTINYGIGASPTTYQDSFDFDDFSNMTINNAWLAISVTGGGAGASNDFYFNGIKIGSGSGVTEFFNTTLNQSNFIVGGSQSFSIVRTSLSSTVNWAMIYVNYTYNNPLTTIRGQNEIHVSSPYNINETGILNAIANANNSANNSFIGVINFIGSGSVNYTWFDLKFANINSTLLNVNQSLSNQMSNMNSTIASQLLSIISGITNIRSDITSLNENLSLMNINMGNNFTSLNANMANNFTFVINNISAMNNNLNNINNSLSELMVNIDNHVLSVNQTTQNKLDILQSNMTTVLLYLSEINYTVNNLNISVNVNATGLNVTATVDLSPVLIAIANLNNTVLSINTSTMAKLNLLESDIISVNNTVNNGFAITWQNLTAIRNDITSVNNSVFAINNSIFNAVLSVNNTVLASNQSLSNQLSSISVDTSNILGNLSVIKTQITSVNNTVLAVNGSLSQQLSNTNSSIWIGLNNIRSDIVSVNDTIKSLNFTVDLSSVYNNLTYIEGQVTNLTVLVYTSNQSIANQIVSLSHDMSLFSFNVSSNLTAVNLSLSNQITNVPSNVWTYFNRTLTSFNFLVDLTQNSINQIIGPIGVWILGNFTVTNQKIDDINQTLYIMNSTFFSNLQTIQSDLVSVNDTVKSTNASLSNQITAVYNHIDDVLDEVRSVNTTVKEVNASIMNKLFGIQDEITSVNDTLKNMNLTLPTSIWEYPVRNLTFYPYFNTTAIMNLTVINQTVSVNGTEIGLAVWNTTSRILTFYPQGLNASDVWNYYQRNLTYYEVYNDTNLTNIVLGMNTTFFNELYNVQLDLISVNDTVKATNASLSNQLSTVINDISNVFNAVIGVNNTVVYVNTSIINAITNLHNDVLSINQSLSYQISNISTLSAKQVWEYSSRNLTWYPTGLNASDVWNYSNRSLTEFNFVVNVNITSQLNELLDAIVSVNNTVKDVNATLSNQLTTVYDHVSEVLLEIAQMNNTMLLINSTTTAELLKTQSMIQGINVTDIVLSLGYNQTSMNQSIMEALQGLNVSVNNSAISESVWTYGNRTLTEFSFNVTGNFTCPTCNLTGLYEAIANMNNSMFAINDSTMSYLQGIKSDIVTVNESVYSVNQSLSNQLSDVYNQVNVAINDIASVNNTVLAVNASTMYKLIQIQDEITSVNDTVKSLNATIYYVISNSTNNLTAQIQNITIVTANDVWTYSIRELTNAVNVTAGNITNVQNVQNVNNAEATFADVRYSGATEYQSSETGQISYLFLNTISGNPSSVNNGTCQASIWYPNKTIWITNVSLNYLPASNGVYYYNTIMPTIEGVYTTSAVCNESIIRGYGSSTFHVAPWANEIYLIPNQTGNNTYNITANISSDLYYNLRDFIIGWTTPSTPTQRICADNSTLRLIQNYTVDIGSSPVVYSKTDDYYCELGCNSDTTPPSCNPKSQVSIFVFIIVSVISLVLMFAVYSPIVNMIGSLMLMVEGIYVAVAGIDFVTMVGMQGTALSYTMNSTLTYGIALVFIGLALYKLAAAFSRTQDQR